MATKTIANAATTWKIDPVHSVAEFRVKHMMISNVRGQFTGISGTLIYDEQDLSRSHVEASIDARTLDTRNTERDTHLKSPDFFDVERFPDLYFSSSSVTRNSDGTVTVTGAMTIHGITHEVQFAVDGPTPPVKDPWGNTRIGLTARATIDRREFGLTFNAPLDAGGVLVGDEVAILLELELVKA